MQYCFSLLPLFLFSLALSLSSPAQDISCFVYNQNRGLAHNHVYSLLQDSRGFMWFATETGVSRFDGISFTNFFASDGLTDNEILEIYEGDHGKIWFMTYAPGLSYYQNGKIFNRFNDSIFLHASFTAFVKQMCSDKSGKIYLLTEKNEIYSLTDKPVEEKLSLPEKNLLFLWKNLQGDLWLLTNNYYCNISSGKTIASKHPVPSRKTLPASLNDGTLVKESEKGIVRFDFVSEKTIIPADSIGTGANYIYADRSDNLWLMQKQGVLYFEKKGNEWKKKGLFLHDYTITRILQDTEGGMWFTTSDKGVLYSPSQKTRTFFPSSEKSSSSEVYCITGDGNGKIWFGLGGNKIGVIAQEKQEILPATGGAKSIVSFFRTLDIFPQADVIWLGGDNGVFRISEKQDIKQIYASGCKKITGYGNSIYGGFAEGVVELAENENEIFPKRKIFSGRTHAIAVFNDSLIFIGTNNGLKLFNGKTIIDYPENNPVQHRITDIKIAKDGTVWYATFGWGAGFIKNGTASKINRASGLSSDICKSLFIDEKNSVWIATNNGINALRQNNSGQFDILTYTTRDGLPSNDINDIYVHSDTVWVASSAGVSCFNHTLLLRQNKTPLVYIHKIAINQNDTVVESGAEFPHNYNNITLHYTGISYQSFGHITYKYRLSGIEKEWNFSASPLVLYSSLPAGKYQFEVFALSADAIQSEKPATFAFSVEPRFMFSKPAIAVEFVVLCSLLLFLVKFVSATTKKRERQKAGLAVQFAESEMKALRAQMNPHFIFNAINTLQGYIIDSDKKAAYGYLEKFGSLMRNVLEQSAEKWITLQDEIDTLNIYLKLEASRFDQKFDYLISFNENINPVETLIPPMLLQPYIENAIKHGIIPKNEKGEIYISFKTTEKMLVCSITDNGIGRKKSMEIKSGHERKSFGMDITKQRIDLLSKIFDDIRFRVIIHDLFDKQQVATGTLVEIFIPLNIHRPGNDASGT